ncbi:RCC1 domain-containing protein [Streptomyces sp. NPDC055815]
MSVPHTLPGARRRPRPRRRLAVVAALAAALLLPGPGLSAPSPAYADSAGARDIRTAPPGTVLTWGSNLRGELGDGSTTGAQLVPGRACGNAVCTTPLDRIVQVAGADGHSIALREDGTVVAWGANSGGQLGDGTRTDRDTPVQVCAVGEPAPCASFLKGVAAVAAGDHHSIALLADGTVVAWGTGGLLGDGTVADGLTPVRVCAVGSAAPCTSYLTGITRIAAGYQHTLALRSDGYIIAWGHNGNGQLGDGTTTPRPAPVFVNGVFDAVSVAAGIYHSVAALSTGSVMAWGYGDALGNGTGGQATGPAPVCAIGQTAPCTSYLTGVTSVAAGAFHTLAVRTDGTALAWGNNIYGQLGDGTTTDRRAPVRVCAPGGCSGYLSGVSAVVGGVSGYHSLALRTDGSVRAWGANHYGQLGDGTKLTRHTPFRVCAVGQSSPCLRYLEGVTSLSSGEAHSIAVSRPLADLATSLAASPEPVSNGGTLTYTIRVRNHGPTAAEDVVLTDNLPATVRFTSATPSSGTCDTPAVGSTDTVTCRFDTLAAGGTATLTLKVLVRSTAAVTDGASATSSTPDPRTGNNAATITTPLS